MILTLGTRRTKAETEADMHVAIQMHNSGYTYLQIQDALGYESVGSISNLIKKAVTKFGDSVLTKGYNRQPRGRTRTTAPVDMVHFDEEWREESVCRKYSDANHPHNPWISDNLAELAWAADQCYDCRFMDLCQKYVDALKAVRTPIYGAIAGKVYSQEPLLNPMGKSDDERKRVR